MTSIQHSSNPLCFNYLHNGFFQQTKHANIYAYISKYTVLHPVTNNARKLLGHLKSNQGPGSHLPKIASLHNACPPQKPRNRQQAISDSHWTYLNDNTEATQNRGVHSAFSNFSLLTSITEFEKHPTLTPLSRYCQLLALHRHTYFHALPPNWYIMQWFHSSIRSDNLLQVTYPFPRTQTFHIPRCKG